MKKLIYIIICLFFFNCATIKRNAGTQEFFPYENIFYYEDTEKEEFHFLFSSSKISRVKYYYVTSDRIVELIGRNNLYNKLSNDFFYFENSFSTIIYDNNDKNHCSLFKKQRPLIAYKKKWKKLELFYNEAEFISNYMHEVSENEFKKIECFKYLFIKPNLFAKVLKKIKKNNFSMLGKDKQEIMKLLLHDKKDKELIRILEKNRKMK